jgi:hypothetical protein
MSSTKPPRPRTASRCATSPSRDVDHGGRHGHLGRGGPPPVVRRPRGLPHAGGYTR